MIGNIDCLFFSASSKKTPLKLTKNVQIIITNCPLVRTKQIWLPGTLSLNNLAASRNVWHESVPEEHLVDHSVLDLHRSFPNRVVLTHPPLSDITHNHFRLVLENIHASLIFAPQSCKELLSTSLQVKTNGCYGSSVSVCGYGREK